MMGWAFFSFLVLGFILLDLGILEKKPLGNSLRRVSICLLIWLFLVSIFAFYLYKTYNAEAVLQFSTAFIVEFSLSIDNIFVFILIFKLLNIPSQHHHHILMWGIIGAFIMRGLMMYGGITLLQHFEWIKYLFGLILFFTGFKLLRHLDEFTSHPWLKKLFSKLSTSHSEKGKFLIQHNNKWKPTPLLIALLAIEGSDLVFALDSIPAVLAISQEMPIVYSANIFAILGLRSLFSLFSHLVGKFKYLKHSLASILIFVGFKMVIEDWYKVPILFSLGIIITLFALGLLSSLIHLKYFKGKMNH
jgi:tellurite resistance protein TerC